MKVVKKVVIQDGAHRFEPVDEFPSGYEVWNIGRKNFPHERCIPLARDKKSEYDWQCLIDPTTLKYIVVETEELALRILKEASRRGIDRKRFLEMTNV